MARGKKFLPALLRRGSKVNLEMFGALGPVVNIVDLKVVAAQTAQVAVGIGGFNPLRWSWMSEFRIWEILHDRFWPENIIPNYFVKDKVIEREKFVKKVIRIIKRKKLLEKSKGFGKLEFTEEELEAKSESVLRTICSHQGLSSLGEKSTLIPRILRHCGYFAGHYPKDETRPERVIRFLGT